MIGGITIGNAVVGGKSMAAGNVAAVVGTGVVVGGSIRAAGSVGIVGTPGIPPNVGNVGAVGTPGMPGTPATGVGGINIAAGNKPPKVGTVVVVVGGNISVGAVVVGTPPKRPPKVGTPPKRPPKVGTPVNPPKVGKVVVVGAVGIRPRIEEPHIGPPIPVVIQEGTPIPV